jgi:hypothetical protein
MKQLTKQIVPVLILTTVLMTVVLGWVTTNRLLTIKTQSVKNQAVQDCFLAVKKEWTNEDVSAQEIDVILYERCMRDKGYETK